MSLSTESNQAPLSPQPETSEERDGDQTASSPAPKAAHHAAQARTWSKDVASKLLSLLFRSLFFVLSTPGYEDSQDAAEACKKVVIQNLVESVLVGVDLGLLTAGGFWGKALNKVVKGRLAQRRTSTGSAGGLSPDSEVRQVVSPEGATCQRGLDGNMILPPPSSYRPVSGHKGTDLESHCKANQKNKLKTKGGKVKRLQYGEGNEEGQGQLDGKPQRKQNEWFEIEGVVYRRGIRLNPDLLSRDANGEMVVHLPFLTFSDPRCDEPTRELAALLEVTDVRAWTFKLSSLEGEPRGWAQPKGKREPEASARAAKLLNNDRHLPKFHLDPQPTCVPDDKNDQWFIIFLSKLGGFSTIADVTFNAKTGPGEECLIIKPAKGAKGPDYIVNEYFGTSPNKVLIKRKFSELEGASEQPFDEWAHIRVPLPERRLDFKVVQKKRIKNGMIVLMIKKLPPMVKEEELIEL